MDKKNFIEIMEELMEIKKNVDDLSAVLKRFEPDFNFISFGKYEALIVKTLKEAMNDKNEWTSYWLYELDCGKEVKNKTVVNKNGKNITIKTLNDLYNLIKDKYANGI